jgi:hypothetical protein
MLEEANLKLQVQGEKEKALTEQKAVYMDRHNSQLTSRIEELFSENKQLHERLAMAETQAKQ